MLLKRKVVSVWQAGNKDWVQESGVRCWGWGNYEL
jgi:hypothetical protein